MGKPEIKDIQLKSFDPVAYEAFQMLTRYTNDLEDLLRRIINLNIPPRCCRFSTTILVKKGHASGCLVIQAKALLERTGIASTEPEAASSELWSSDSAYADFNYPKISGADLSGE